jgi:transposase
MELLYRQCAGLDVHKDSVVVCVLSAQSDGTSAATVSTFGTTTSELTRLGDYLAAQRVTIAAMESTGVYWKPVWNLLEGRLELLLVNAKHIKQVPGRKTDVKDCQWIAQLLQHGLLKGSVVPERELRDLRDLTRGRTCLVRERARVANRIQKILEDANIKLGSVASDVLGASGTAMLEALIAGDQSPEEMAELAKYRMRRKIPELTEALRGKVTDHHRFLLKSYLEQVEHLDEQIAAFEARMEQIMGPFVREAVERLDPIPGIDRQGAIAVIAEIGPDMGRFATADHLCAWAGMCPGNNQSGGKRRHGRLKEGNRWLKAMLNQVAWAATRKKGSFFGARYRRLVPRRGGKRALMATGHSILIAIYEVLARKVDYVDLGAEFYDQRHVDRTKHYLVKRLEKMGYDVTLKAPAA